MPLRPDPTRISTGSPWVATLDDGSAESTATFWISLGVRRQDERGDLRALARLELGDLVEPFGGPIGVPDGAGQVGQDVDDVHRPVALGDRRVDLAHRGVERPIDRADRQLVDPLQRRRRRQPDRHARLGRVDDEDQARIGHLGEDLRGPLLGLVEPRLVFVLVFHRQAGVEDQAQRRRHATRRPAGPASRAGGRARASAIKARIAIRASSSSQFLIRIRFFDCFCRSRISRSAGKMTCLGVCRMNRCRITGSAASAAPAASPAWINDISMACRALPQARACRVSR